MSKKRIFTLTVLFVIETTVYIAFAAYTVLYLQWEPNAALTPLIVLAVVFSAIWLFILYYPMFKRPRNAKNYTADVFNNVEWRWDWAPAGPVIKGAFCTKCKAGLVPLNATESWQPDLKCPACGKSYVSFAGNSPDGKARTCAETRLLVVQKILEKNRD